MKEDLKLLWDSLPNDKRAFFKIVAWVVGAAVGITVGVLITTGLALLHWLPALLFGVIYFGVALSILIWAIGKVLGEIH